MLLWPSISVPSPSHKELGHAVQSSSPLAKVTLMFKVQFSQITKLEPLFRFRFGVRVNLNMGFWIKHFYNLQFPYNSCIFFFYLFWNLDFFKLWLSMTGMLFHRDHCHSLCCLSHHHHTTSPLSITKEVFFGNANLYHQWVFMTCLWLSFLLNWWQCDLPHHQWVFMTWLSCLLLDDAGLPSLTSC